VLRWATTRKGILALGPTLIYCFWRSDPHVANSDLQLTFTPASYKEGVQGQLEDEPGMTVASWQQRPESRGYVRIRSADPFAPPIIQTNYLVEELDRRVVVAGMKLARRLLASAPLSQYYAYEDFPGPKVQSDDEFLAAATERGTTTFHPGCTCRMGPADAKWAVVDDQLRVHGLQGLRVVDASIMPRMISANLNASTLMIADKASDMIRGKTALEAVRFPVPALGVMRVGTAFADFICHQLETLAGGAGIERFIAARPAGKSCGFRRAAIIPPARRCGAWRCRHSLADSRSRPDAAASRLLNRWRAPRFRNSRQSAV
jgi:choline dehydrogenase